MHSGFSYLPANETPERKQAALRMYAIYFGEDAPPSSDPDARYMAAVVAMSNETKATPRDILEYEKTMAIVRRKAARAH